MLPIRLAVLLLSIVGSAAASPTAHYDADYQATVKPQAGTIDVELQLKGEDLPSRIVLHIDARRHRQFTSTDPLEVGATHVTWRPRGRTSRLRYQFVVDHERGPKRYDSLMTRNWALFRGEKLVPRAQVTAPRGLQSRASLRFNLPADWASQTPYASVAPQRYAIDDRGRSFDQPKGWMLVGKIGVRSEQIGGSRVTVAAPVGDSVRRQDTLAFLNWTLPPLLEVFPSFPQRLLIVSAGDPMWRGGLSGPASIFLHSERPLISENRTSTLLHEIVHVAMGLRSNEESDWIVEGLAEFYSIEALRRSGSISEVRYVRAIERLERWGRDSPTLFEERSNGATTARAVVALRAADAEIRALTAGKASLDDVARALAAQRGTISLARLQQAAARVAGRPLRSLERTQLTKPAAAPAP